MCGTETQERKKQCRNSNKIV